MTQTVNNTELHGEIVTWDTKSSDVPISKIRDALKAAGLPDVAHDLNNRSAFMRATAALKENRSIDKVTQSNDGKITFQLTRKSNDGKQVNFSYETQVTLDSVTGDISSGDSVIELEARKLFAHAMQVRTASDITRMVQKLFKENADLFPVNPSKGVAYFVPQRHAAFTKCVEQFLHDVGGNVWRFPVPKGTDQGNRSVQEAVATGLRATLDELNHCVDEWDDTTRQDTMKRGIEKWQTIKYKCDCYAEMLTDMHSKLLNEMEEAKKKLVDKITEVRPEEASAAA